MFIDYVPLLLINMAAGLCVLAHFIVKGLGTAQPQRWAPPFAAAGIIAFLFGGHMTIAWPLPGSYNVAFGELSVLLGILFLGAAAAAAKNWAFDVLGIYAFLAGLAACAVGVRIIHMGMTAAPLISGAGFLLTGSGGLFAWAAIRLAHIRSLRLVAAAVLCSAAAIWTAIAIPAYWDHLARLAKWTPPGMVP